MVGPTGDIGTNFPYKNEFVKQWNKINMNGVIYSTDKRNKTNSNNVPGWIDLYDYRERFHKYETI